MSRTKALEIPARLGVIPRVRLEVEFHEGGAGVTAGIACVEDGPLSWSVEGTYWTCEECGLVLAPSVAEVLITEGRDALQAFLDSRRKQQKGRWRWPWARS
jgi:hypothetical protein